MQNRNPQTVLQETGINNTDVTTWALPEGAIARLGRGIVGPLSPDGKHLVSAHHKKSAQLWDIENGAQITELSLNRPRDATKYKGDDRQIQRILRHVEKGSVDKRTPKAIAFSPNGDLIAGDVLG